MKVALEVRLLPIVCDENICLYPSTPYRYEVGYIDLRKLMEDPLILEAYH
jgi:hypothetical protein